jgi:hypothetical protein
MTVFNLDESTLKTLNKLYKDHKIESKEVTVQIGLALGIITNTTKGLKRPKPFHTLAEIDRNKAFTVIATTRNLELNTEEDVVRELERYAEGGLKILIDQELKTTDKLDIYKMYRKYSE